MEAPVTETAPVGAVAPEVMPDSPMAKAETLPEVKPEAPEIAPVVPEKTEVEIYQDILAKDKETPGYQMTDEEGEAFLNVQEQIMGGHIKEPGLKNPDEKPPETSTPEPKAEGEKTDVTPTPPPEGTPELTDSMADYLQKAMTKVGAKDISELPQKVDGLINQMKSTGGKLGGERNQLQTQVDQHTNFMQALRSKDPQAIEHFNKLMGYTVTQSTPSSTEGAKPQSTGGDTEFGDPEEYLDNKLAPVVQNLIKTVNELKKDNQELKSKDVGRDQHNQQLQATNSWVDDIVQLVADHPSDYGINTSEARALAKFYWSPDGAKTAVHPKFQSMHKLIEFAHTGNMPDLETAHVMWQHKNGDFAKKLIQATKDGQHEATHIESPNAVISNKQGRTKTDVPSPHITDDSVTAMEGGDLGAIPDEWMDDLGNLIPSQVPQRFHEQAFGRAGKPK